MTRALLVLALTACTSVQSARTLAPGSATVSVGLGRASSFEENVDEGDWAGHLMVRFGLVDGFDLGLHAVHTPGNGGVGVLAIDPKVQLAHTGRIAVSVGSPAGIVVGEAPEASLEGYFVLPALYVGVEVSPSVEMIVTARYNVGLDADNPTRTGYGAAFAPRFIDETKTWAVQPEIGVLHAEETTYLTFGLTIAVGH